MAQYASYSGYLGGAGGGGGGITTINGETGPAIMIAAGTGITITTLSDTITINSTQAILGAAVDIYVDAQNGSDANDGTIISPFQTIAAAQSSFSDESATKPYTIHLASGFYPTPNPIKQYVNIVGVAPDMTATDDIFINYGGSDDFEQVLSNFTALGVIVITRNPGQTVNNSLFLLDHIYNGNGISMTGSGDTFGGSPFIFDFLHMNYCNVASPSDFHAISHTMNNCSTSFISYDAQGVDTVSTAGLTQSCNNNRIAGFVDVSDIIEVDARNSCPNRVRLHGVDPVYFGDATSFPVGDAANSIQLLAGATLDQIGFFTINNRIRIPTAGFDDGYTIRQFIDRDMYSAPSSPGPMGVNLPELNGGGIGEGMYFNVIDDLGTAGTDTITVSALGTNDFRNGQLTDQIKFNNGGHLYKFSGGRWDLGPVHRMGDTMFGGLDISGTGQLLNVHGTATELVRINGAGVPLHVLGDGSDNYFVVEDSGAGPLWLIDSTGALVNQNSKGANPGLQMGGSQILADGGIDCSGQKIVNVQDPTAAQDAATKNYVDTNFANVTLTAFGSTPNANGASLSGQALTLQPADATHPGGISTTTQTLAGDKTLSGNTLIAQSAASVATIGATSSTAIHQVNGGLNFTTRTITANLTIDTTTTDMIILCNQSGAITVTLPTPTNGRMIIIKDISGTAATNNITVAQHAAEKIENVAASKVIQGNFDAMALVSEGTNWWMV